MPQVSDVLGWSAFLLLLLRYFGFGTFAIAYWDASVFVRVAIQVHAASRGSSLAAGGGGRRCRDGEAVEGDRRTRMASPRPRTPPSQQQQRRPSPPHPRQDVFDPKEGRQPKARISHMALMSMYEDIMATDAETIQHQQATIQSQQETIRSQREMVHRLRLLVEAQDSWIEEHLEEPLE
ncbi:hypothetical protein BS50DRAFT_618665 [Corynespora cassiicola Philippines]|uniref:Uncharacterized protein n=1 Tax=Corynespora cassiicola Philippines TaxID=1448308 RepID=A0A2T2NWI3_CORCC|nr:hypothetical protein BS50DRAFT_618665 [Corynespora cassiicola Philippines]